jgi:glycosyltransferase involved in cell wall biosynthesis
LFNIQLPALLHTQRYDLVVGFDIDGFLCSGTGGDTPYLVAIKGVIAEEMQHECGRTRLLFEVLSRLERHNARGADAVLTTSNYCRDAIERRYGVPARRVLLVPEGIDLPRWRRIAAQPRASDGATILCVARQYPRKHIADLLRALPIVLQDVPHTRTVIIGDGPQHAALRRLAAELSLDAAVQFRGSLPDDEQVARCYRQADIFCLPSVQEGFGIVFLEAMASGLPIVAARAAAVPEVVPQGRAGLLVPPSDVTALAEALIELLKNPDQRAAYGAFGQEYVVRYDWDRVAGVFLDQVAPFLARAQ